MNAFFRRSLAASLVLALPMFYLSGCSGKTEDVRIVLCKEVTDRLLADMRPIEWTAISQRINRPAFAVIRLEFTAGKQKAMQSECYFAYDTVEENVVTHVDELSAYATLPYRMTIDGQEVPQQIRQKAVSEEQIEGLAEFMEKINGASRKLLSQ
ncbi:MAG: hypothetical protein R3179_01220 [Sedimenticolaceae bacterium]|nr:hypothetical protein [Sedimenticolaceae bacterium]